MRNNIVENQPPPNFVGNRLATALDLIGPDKKTLRDKYLVGEPQDCPIGSAAEMKKKGFVGIYQRASEFVLRLPTNRFLRHRAA